MADVKELLAVLAAQEQQRLDAEQLQIQREIDAKQRHADIRRLQDDLTVFLRNREYNKSVMIEQLQRDPTCHGEVITKLIADTWEAIFLFKYPNVDQRIQSLTTKLESLQQ